MASSGLDRMGEDESRRYLRERVSGDLEGHPLISNRSIWRNFPLITTQNWVVDNKVLIGDAFRNRTLLHRFRLLGSHVKMRLLWPAPSQSLRTYARRSTLSNVNAGPVVEKIVKAANRSSFWYERLADEMQKQPWELAYDYMTRSGRMTEERLRQTAPQFMGDGRVATRGDPQWKARRNRQVSDPVRFQTEGAREIEFDIPERYSASDILFNNVAAGRGDKIRDLLRRDAFHVSRVCAILRGRVGNALTETGLSSGQRVLLMMCDTPEYVAAIFRAIRAGFVPVLINSLSPARPGRLLPAR